MQLPILNETAQGRDMLQEFRGYNHNYRIGDNEFYDEQNMSAYAYPVLSPRKKRTRLFGIDDGGTKGASILGMLAKDEDIYLAVKETRGSHSGVNLYKNSTYVGSISGTASDASRTLVSMGANIVIFPDKKIVNTNATTLTIESLEKAFTTSGTITFKACNANGDTYQYYATTSAPSSPGNKTYWLDMSEAPYVMKQWSESSSMWFQVSTVYIRIEATGIGNGFKEGDGVTISGLSGDAATALADINNKTSLIHKVGTNYIVVTGVLSGGKSVNPWVTLGKAFANLISVLLGGSSSPSLQNTSTAAITQSGSGFKVERKVPDVDYVIEDNNRLWGCRYGDIVDGKPVNEICCCKQGDPTNWNSFAGTSMDSYYVSVGSDGEFTGSAVYGGTILFFKENCIHKIYGNFPANYQLVTTQCEGVQSGSSRSVKTVNGMLYYKAVPGVYAYDGSLPVLISSELGEKIYSKASAGACGNKYYISMSNGAEQIMFTYDTNLGIWHKEDGHPEEYDADILTEYRGSLVYARGDEIWMVDNYVGVNFEGMQTEDDLDWYCETGVIGFESPDNKYISRFNFRMQLDAGSVCNVFIEYDSSGIWELKGSMKGRNLRTFTLPIIPRRCDHLRIKLSGHGDCKIYSIAKITETGSDIR